MISFAIPSERLAEEQIDRVIAAFGVAVSQVDRSYRGIEAQERAARDDNVVKRHVAAILPDIPGFQRGAHIDRHAEASRWCANVSIENGLTQRKILSTEFVRRESRKPAEPAQRK